MLSAKTYMQVTGTIFSVVGLMHLLRLFYGWVAVIGGWEVPMWVSIVGIFVAWYLAYNAFMMAKKKK